jgi:iron-sulfur cluster assembly accessory protein
MSVKITASAAREFKKVIVEQQMPDTIALRVGVKGGGCSGFEYQLEFDDKVNEDADLLVEMHGVRVAVDKKSSLFLDGTEIDFHESLDKRGFVFNNPNATKSCGCGSSFSA